MGILFWIHGGGFSSGDSRMYSGIEHAMQEGNAVVVVQYRLGVLGFFNAFDSTSNKTLGGNYGLGDIALALEFIHRNAEKFGANSSHIVVNGESAGSAATMALLMHEPSVNRMAGVVAQSGGTVMNFLSTEKVSQLLFSFFPEKNLSQIDSYLVLQASTQLQWRFAKNYLTAIKLNL